MSHRHPGRRAIALLPLLAALLLASAGARAQGSPPAASTVYLPQLQAPAGRPSGAASLDLIDAALKRGEIGAEAALIYKTFAIFGDRRLPAAYRGAAVGEGGEEVLAELTSSFATLSPRGQATLQPFTIPPFHAGSWWDIARSPAGAARAAEEGENRFWCNPKDFPVLADWRAVDSANGKARVWYQTGRPADVAQARLFAAQIDTIWAELHGLLGREPMRDNGSVLPCRGGDDRIDISIADIGHAGYVRPYILPLWHSPGFAVIDSGLSPAEARATLTHELMHLFQMAYDFEGFYEYRWWLEATATWAEHYVESRAWPGDQHNLEHQPAYSYFKWHHAPLESDVGGKDARMYYRAYMFPFFDLVRTGKGELVRRSFERSETMGDSLENLDGLLPGGFRKQWPQFSVRLLNRPPVDDYRRADTIPHEMALAGDEAVALNGAQSRSYLMNGEVEHLASLAYRFSFDDPSVRSVALVNPYYGGAWPTASMQILYRANGVWEEEDLTELNGKPWCRDFKAERVEELYVVISNSEWADREHVLEPAEPPRLNVTNIACRGWEVEAKVLAVDPHFAGERSSETVVSTARLERQRPESYAGGIGQLEVYEVVSGSVSWHHKGTFASCSGEQKGGYQLGRQGYALAIHQYALRPTGAGYSPTRTYHGYGGDERWKGVQIPYGCPNGRVDLNSTLHGFWFLTGLPAENPGLAVDPTGAKISGTYHFGDAEQWQDFSWTMTALPPE